MQMAMTATKKDISQYNCGGFALRTYNWLAPYYDSFLEDLSDEQFPNDIKQDEYTDEYRDDLALEMFDDGYSNYEIAEDIVELDKEFLLNHYSFLEEISEDEIEEHNCVIAYRMFYEIDDDGYIADSDFHFKVLKDGKWFEKCGCLPIRECQLDAYKPWRYTDLTYDSPIIYFVDTRFE